MTVIGIKIWCKDNSVKIVESYEEVQTAWWNFHFHISHIEVIDAKRTKRREKQGIRLRYKWMTVRLLLTGTEMTLCGIF